MKKSIPFFLSLLFSIGVFGQFESFQVERFNKRLDVIISDPGISAHFPVGLIYQDTSQNAFTNLSDRLLRIADGPIGFQFMNQNILFTETGKNYYSINRFDNPFDQIFWLGPSQPGYWGPRTPPGNFGSQYDFNTWGDIYTIDIQGRKLSELTESSGKGAVKFYRYDGGFIYIHQVTVDDFGNPDWSAVSDRRAKENISDIANILPRVLQLEMKNYNYIGNELQTRGYIAQEVQEQFPDLVSEMDNGLLGVNYMGFGTLAIQAINEQQEIIESLKERIERLECLFR